MLVPEAANAWPEEAADFAPTGRDRAAEHGQADSDVQLPGRSGDASRNEEVEHRDSAAGSDDPGELLHRRSGVVDVAEEIRESQRVEGRILEGQVLRPPFLEPDSLAETRSVDARPARGQHLGALVDPDDAAAVLADELDRHRRGAARNVEDGRLRPASIRSTRNARQRGSWPKESSRA